MPWFKGKYYPPDYVFTNQNVTPYGPQEPQQSWPEYQPPSYEALVQYFLSGASSDPLLNKLVGPLSQEQTLSQGANAADKYSSAYYQLTPPEEMAATGIRLEKPELEAAAQVKMQQQELADRLRGQMEQAAAVRESARMQYEGEIDKTKLQELGDNMRKEVDFKIAEMNAIATGKRATQERLQAYESKYLESVKDLTNNVNNLRKSPGMGQPGLGDDVLQPLLAQSLGLLKSSYDAGRQRIIGEMEAETTGGGGGGGGAAGPSFMSAEQVAMQQLPEMAKPKQPVVHPLLDIHGKVVAPIAEQKLPPSAVAKAISIASGDPKKERELAQILQIPQKAQKQAHAYFFNLREEYRKFAEDDRKKLGYVTVTFEEWLNNILGQTTELNFGPGASVIPKGLNVPQSQQPVNQPVGPPEMSFLKMILGGGFNRKP